MSVTSYVVPISKASNTVLECLLAAGQLRVTDETVIGTSGEVHAPSDALVPTIQAASDFSLTVGTETITADLFRLPEWEYSTLLRASPDFHQPPLAHLMPDLLGSRRTFPEASWTRKLGDALSTAPIVGPYPLLVSEPWADTGRFCAEQTRFVLRDGLWWLHLVFELDLTRDEPDVGVVLAADVGLQPAITVVGEGGSVHTVPGVMHLSSAGRRQLLVETTARGIDPATVLRTLRVLKYAAARQIIEEQFLLYIAVTARAMIIERLNYSGFSRGVVQQTRDEAIRDCWTAWLPQRAHAYDIQLIKVNPAYTSRDCSRCPFRNAEQIGTFICANCGYTTVTHINAAQNVLKRGLPLVR